MLMSYGGLFNFKGSSTPNDILVGNTGSTFFIGGNTSISGTISATNLSGTNTGDQTLAGLGGQPQLNGTGFVKASGTTISYDNSSYLPLTGGTLTGTLDGTSATFSGNITIGAASLLYLTSGDLIYSSNAGFGIVTQNGNRLVSIQNGIFGVNGAATFSSSISATSATFSGILTTPQVKAATSAGLSINANSGTQVADFGAGGSANITFFGGLNGTSATFSGLVTNYNVFNRQTSSYTLVLGDASKIIEMDALGANTVTVPTNASVAFPIGTEITVMQLGAGNTTLVAASGVTFRSIEFSTRIADQYTGATLIKRGTNEWYIIGNIAP